MGDAEPVCKLIKLICNEIDFDIGDGARRIAFGLYSWGDETGISCITKAELRCRLQEVNIINSPAVMAPTTNAVVAILVELSPVLDGLTRMLETPAIDVLPAGVENRPDTNLGELLTFM